MRKAFAFGFVAGALVTVVLLLVWAYPGTRNQ